MSLARRTGRGVTTSIWTGFVDAMTGLLLVLTFVLTMFAIVQFVLSGMISSQSDELAALDRRIANLNLTVSEGDEERRRLVLQITGLTEDLGLRDSRISELEIALEGKELDLRDAAEESTSRQILINELTSDRDRGLAEIGGLQIQLADIRSSLAKAVDQLEELVAQRAELAVKLEESGEANRLVEADRDRVVALLALANAESAKLVEEVTNAEKKEQGYLADIEALQLALGQAEGERDRESGRIVDLLASLERATERLASETSRADMAETARLKALEDIAALQEALGAATRESNARRATILAFESQVAGLEERIVSLVQQNLDAESLQTATLEELESVRQENQLLLARTDEAADDLIAMDLDLAAKRKEAEETLTLLAATEQARIELEASLVALRQEFKRAVEQLTQIRSEREAALVTQSNLESDLASRQSALDRTVVERDEATRAIAKLEAELNFARDEVAALRRAQDDAENRIAAAGRDLEAGAQARAALQSRLSVREEEYRTALGEIEALSARLSEEQARALKFEAGLNAANDEIEALRRAQDDAENRIAAAGRDLEAGVQARAELQSRLSIREEEYRTALGEIEALSAQLSEEQARALEFEVGLDAANDEIETLRRERDDSENRIAAADRDLEVGAQARAELQSQLSIREEEYRTALGEIEALSARLSEEQARALKFEAGLNAANDEIEALRRVQDDAENRIAAAGRDIEAGVQAQAELQSQLSIREEEYRTALGEIEALSARLSEEQAGALKLEAGLNAANDEIEILRRERDDAENRIAAAIRDLGLGAQARAELQSQLSIREEEYRTALGEIEALSARLSEEQARALKFEAGLNAANDEIEILRRERDDAEGRFAMASRGVELGIRNIQAQLDQSREENRTILEENARLRELLDESDRTVANLSLEKEQANSQLESIERQLEAATELASLLETARMEMQQSLDRAAEEAQKEARQDAERLAELDDQLTESKSKIAELEAENRRSASELERALQDSTNSEILQGIAENLLKKREEELKQSESEIAEYRRQQVVLNLQIRDLRERLGGLQAILDTANQRNEQQKTDNEIELTSLGTQLNEALAQLAEEEARARRLEEAERQRLQAQNKELEGFRSEFLGRLRTVIEGKEGVRIQGDRFVFASEVLFPLGKAELSDDGKEQIKSVADLILSLANEFPDSIDWVLRVDGHTDDRPIVEKRDYSDNWELSQARSLSVVRFLTSELGFPENRLAAAGFGEYRPVNSGLDEAAKSQNRRIEFKLTEP